MGLVSLRRLSHVSSLDPFGTEQCRAPMFASFNKSINSFFELFIQNRKQNSFVGNM